ncbi:baseplate J/gp47 family protein [Faecalispora anaeroviscerum]|uniref:baseplate J/gp47 family protein n=1 Tax=Faecalispora anaeroviscerum TaxID=2991836 RepID=UPI0024B8F727|nr:baseplate J/gp47 family protein [Faecalispora anaeroviscerum]
MAEPYEYEAILKQMLDRVPDDIDKREGSIIYHTLAPTAFVLAQQTYMIAYLTDLLFADTAQEEWLERVTSDFGIDREQATQAVRQINTFDSSGAPKDIPIGSRFAVQDVSFTVTEKIAVGQYKAVCDQSGIQGNAYGGSILPVDNINGLASAELISPALIPARDQETDDDLRTRFQVAVRQQPYGGNIADYKEKTLAIDGVGAVQVFGAPSMGAGRVGLIIGDEQGNTATQTLVDQVQAVMGTDGDGIAPIGHTVTVGTSVNLPVNITAQIRLKSGVSLELVKASVERAIADYIGSIDFAAETVFYAKLVANILNAHESIVDVGTVTMNGVSANLSLLKNFTTFQVPTIGAIAVSEVVG